MGLGTNSASRVSFISASTFPRFGGDVFCAQLLPDVTCPSVFDPEQRFRDWRNQWAFDLMLKRLRLKLYGKKLIDLETWMIDSTAVRATRASSGVGKK